MGIFQLRMLVLSQFTSSSLNLLLTKHHYRYNGSPITTEGKCDEEKQIPITVFEFGHQKRLSERILSNHNGCKNCFWKLCSTISLTKTSLGVQFDIYRKYTWNCFMTITRTGDGDFFLISIKQDSWWRLHFRQVIQIFFIYSFKYLTMTLHPQKIPRGPIQDC